MNPLGWALAAIGVPAAFWVSKTRADGAGEPISCARTAEPFGRARNQPPTLPAFSSSATRVQNRSSSSLL